MKLTQISEMYNAIINFCSTAEKYEEHLYKRFVRGVFASSMGRRVLNKGKIETIKMN